MHLVQIFANRFSEETAKSFANNFQVAFSVTMSSYGCETSNQEVFGFFRGTICEQNG